MCAEKEKEGSPALKLQDSSASSQKYLSDADLQKDLMAWPLLCAEIVVPTELLLRRGNWKRGTHKEGIREEETKN